MYQHAVCRSKKKDFERYKKASGKMETELIHLKENCQQLVRAGVTDFAYSNTALKPEMKKVLEERYRKLLRDEAGKSSGQQSSQR